SIDAAMHETSASDRSPTPVVSPSPASVGPIERPPIRTLSRVVEGVAFSLDVPRVGWEPGPIQELPDANGSRHGHLDISKSIVGPQGAEAIVFLTSFPGGDRTDPCPNLLSPSVGPSAADLASAVATAHGTN